MKKILLSAGAGIILILVVVVSSRHHSDSNVQPVTTPAAMGTTSTAPAVTPSCDRPYVENANFSVYAYGCTPDKQGITALFDIKGYRIVSKDGAIDTQFPFKGQVSLADPVMGSIQNTSDHTYLFLDQGSWLVHGLVVFALTGTPRTYVFDYLPRAAELTTNGYLVYMAPSKTYPNAHPEVDMSAATDVHALRLSDFNDRIIYGGTKVLDYSIRLTEYDAGLRDTQGPIVETKEKEIAIVPYNWKDNEPLQTIVLPIASLGA